MTEMMRAAVLHTPGGPEQVKLEEVPVPEPKVGQVLIKVKAFGLNHTDLYTLHGESIGVPLPRIMGIEAAGEVVSAPGGEFRAGAHVVTCMGDMGRSYDGGYAEYTCVPADQVVEVSTHIDWARLGAMPEIFQTAWGSLYVSLQLKPTDRLLVRGGTTAVGLTATAIAKDAGCYVVATTRQESRQQMLLDNGADDVIIDDGQIADVVKERYSGKFTKVLELVGPATLVDSLACVTTGGVVCLTGSVSNVWSLKDFSPMGAVHTATYLTSYAGSAETLKKMPFNDLAQKVVDGVIKLPFAKTFTLDEIVPALHMLEDGTAGGKIVILP